MLLAVAVLLPTVCLLWFMSHAVENDRLAVRQKLMDFYVKRARRFFIEYPDSYWKNVKDHLSSYAEAIDRQVWLLPELVGDELFSGFVVWDASGKLLWPLAQGGEDTAAGRLEVFQEAFELEFGAGSIAAALDEYRSISSQTEEPLVKFHAEMSAVRCLDKSGQTEQAAALCNKLAYPATVDAGNLAVGAQVLRARVRLAELYEKTGSDELFFHLRRVLGNSRYDGEKEQPVIALPSEARIWGLERLIETAERTGLSQKLEYELKKAKRTIRVERYSLAAAQNLSRGRLWRSWPEATIQKLDLSEPVYGIYYKISGKTVLCLTTESRFLRFLRAAVDDMGDETVISRVYDNFGEFAAGAAKTEDRPFLTLPMGRFLPEWKVEFFFTEPAIFENAAGRQTALYTWTGVLVIVLIFASGGLATRMLSRQIKLNRLKNDFMAAVTHELKTPLSSMRVLVDTLLEGSFRDQQQATEYLQLISKENERLSRLIDNFLTFSRMERNRQAFDIIRISPAEVAKVALEAVRTNLNAGKCRLEAAIDENLPEILADKDAMVTVLVNLLENACKYSRDEKHVRLRLFSAAGSVCFEVSDDGIGMSRGTVRRIFKKFYQADRSLSRPAGGCGLGLSIVKFIVDAHKGRITVDSKPGRGSTFTVKLPQVN